MLLKTILSSIFSIFLFFSTASATMEERAFTLESFLSPQVQEINSTPIDGVSYLASAKRFCKRKCRNEVNKKRCRRRCRKRQDRDGDNVRRRFDNCRQHKNADQADSDDDGIGNVCENIDVVLSDSSIDRVFIFKNVLGVDRESGALVTPDLILGDPNTGHYEDDFGKPTDIYVGNNILIVGDANSSRVHIYRDYANLTNNQKADVLLTNYNGSGVDNVRIASDGTDLYVSERNDNEVTIFRDISTLASGDSPDVTISGLNSPRGIALYNNRLFIANSEDDNILVYNNASSLTGSLDDTDADVTIQNDNNNGPLVGDRPIRVSVIDGRLYVMSRDASQFDNDGRLAVYNDQSTLVDDQDPDVVLGRAPSFPPQTDNPHSVALLGDNLFLGNKDAGINVFNSSSSMGELGSIPSFMLSEDSAIDGSLGLAGNASTDILIAPSTDYDIAGLYFSGSKMVSERDPDVLLFSPLMERPHTALIVEN